VIGADGDDVIRLQRMVKLGGEFAVDGDLLVFEPLADFLFLDLGPDLEEVG